MNKKTRFSVSYFISVLMIFLAIQWLFFPPTRNIREITYNSFKAKIDSGKVSKVLILPDRIVGELKDATGSDKSHSLTIGPSSPLRVRIKQIEAQMARQFYVNRLPVMEDPDLLKKLEHANVEVAGRVENNTVQNFFLNWIVPLIVMMLIYSYLFRKMYGSNHFLEIGKNKAKIQAETPSNPVKFSDVAGVDEAVEEVKEIVDFLKNPKKYSRLGGKLPKGILLVGPPGTGKTLLAKAVAGEANVPFFNISGSDFVEMFVGVGAARVRDLFQQAKQQAPCIIFIDEIDAIGKSRANNAAYGGFDERENTLNQLLVEMDGFDANTGAIIIGATNRPDTLDPALLRPGRFDRQVVVDKPDMKGRQAIFKVHTNKLLLSKDVQLERLAAQTPGFAGAEIANVCNEAAIYAVRHNRNEIAMADFEAAIEKVIAGLEKKNKLINEKERKIVAYHEAGHAIVGHFTPGADEVQKVSIVPRGIGALGYTLQMPLEDRYLMTRNELLGKIKGLLGGRAAEEIVFNEVSTGASNDLERVAQLARSMVMMYGMSEKLPNYSLVQRNEANFLGQEARTYRRSEKVEQLIDEEIQHIINSCYGETKQLLINKKDLLEKMAYKLLEKEVLNYHEIKEMLGEKNNSELKESKNLQLIN
ncbi:MAG TPA: ATP-dependent zinc metalloprotease FtsH [Segetibacter sp.]|nr:ATP-dependent zinc metalloprotease FtsH [Segetibacter sp.]